MLADVITQIWQWLYLDNDVNSSTIHTHSVTEQSTLHSPYLLLLLSPLCSPCNKPDLSLAAVSVLYRYSAPMYIQHLRCAPHYTPYSASSTYPAYKKHPLLSALLTLMSAATSDAITHQHPHQFVYFFLLVWESPNWQLNRSRDK